METNTNNTTTRPTRTFSDIITKNPLFSNSVASLTFSKRLQSEEFCWDSTETPLYQHLDDRTNLFLSIAGMNQNYQKSKSKNILLYYFHIFWNTLVITLSLGCYLLFIVEFFVFSYERSILSVLIFSSSIIQVLSLWFATYCNIKRLNTTAEVLEIPHYKEALPNTIMMLIVFIFTTIPIAIDSFPYDKGALEIIGSFLIVVSFIGQSFLFSVSVHFIFVDVESCKQLLLLAIEKQKQGTLTITLLNKVRDEINYRVAKSSWTNNVLLVTASYYLIALVASLFIEHDLIQSREFRVVVAGLMFREIVFLFVSFWEAAKVNELADAFLQTLSHTVAEVGMILERPTEKFISINESIEDFEGKSKDSSSVLSLLEAYRDHRDEEFGQLKLNMKKFSIFMNVAGDPISFKLAGLRLVRRDILVRFGLWLIGLIIGLVGQD